MSPLPACCYQVEKIRVLEQLARQDYHLSGNALMQRAGAAAFNILQKHWPKAKTITIVCGGGNNGGDGYVLAKLAAEQHFNVRVFYVGEFLPSTLLAKEAALDLQRSGVPVRPVAEKMPADFEVDVIVDALVGIGCKGVVSPALLDVIHQINTSGRDVFSIDIPSGLHANTGAAHGGAICATATITFLGLKPGLFTGAGPGHCGAVYFSDLGLEENIYAKISADAKRLSSLKLATYLPRRQRNAHKGYFGHTLIIGGDYGMAGAVRLAAEGAARVGSGLTTVATRVEHVCAVVAMRPELMCHPIHTVDDIEPLLEAASVIVIGPGLGQSSWSRALFQRVVQSKRPMVLDADALNMLAQDAQVHPQDNWVLTPHPGEAARLLACTSADIEQDRFQASRELHKKYGGVIVLKGAGTIVYGPEKYAHICDVGNPGMASGGMGDVLSGVIAGLLAQGLTNEIAARVGVLLHSLAADRAASQGERGLLAADLMSELRHYVNT